MAVRLVARSGGYGPWYAVAGYRQSRTADNRRVWQSTGSTGRLSAHRARLTGLQYGSLHARAVDESTPLPDGVSSIDMLPRFRK